MWNFNLKLIARKYDVLFAPVEDDIVYNPLKSA